MCGAVNIVGREVHTKEPDELFSKMFRRLATEQNIRNVRLHSDNGNPIKGSIMIMTFYRHRILPSFSKPRVNDDNPYSESLFKTFEYTLRFPKYFTDIEHARTWITDFVNWHNTEHRHSGIGYITPDQRHSGIGSKIMKKRNETIMNAYSKNPERWSKKPYHYEEQNTIYLNPSRETKKAS